MVGGSVQTKGGRRILGSEPSAWHPVPIAKAWRRPASRTAIEQKVSLAARTRPASQTAQAALFIFPMQRFMSRKARTASSSCEDSHLQSTREKPLHWASTSKRTDSWTKRNPVNRSSGFLERFSNLLAYFLVPLGSEQLIDSYLIAS